jgi:hypothetical protein
MTVSLLPAQLLATTPVLHVDPGDIVFSNITPERLGIEITFQNPSDMRSEPTVAKIMAAPLGVFVPWRPLLSLPVPPIAPGKSLKLRSQAIRNMGRPFAGSDRVPPNKLLTALADDDDDFVTSSRDRGDQPNSGRLPLDLFQLLGRNNPHWAGNLNVFVNGKSVERHLARALRVYPGQLNLAMFIVGSGGLDAYSFSLEADTDWNAVLYLASGSRALRDFRASSPIAQGEWIEGIGQSLIFLAMQPSRNCREGQLEARVRQRSTGREASVEFSLDPEAAGPGCFVV